MARIEQGRDPQRRQAGLPGAEHVARAPQRQVGLGDGEPIGRPFHDIQPLLRDLIGRIGQEDAVGPMRSAAHPAAELVELGQAEALRVLDQHHGRVRDVDPDLDHGRGHQDVHLAVGHALHRCLADGRWLLAVDQAHPDLRKRRGQALGLRLGRRRGQGVALGDERHDDEDLAAGLDLVGEEGLDLGQGRAVADLGPDGLPSRRRHAQGADRQVAVHGQGQRPGDGRGGQGQHVRLQVTGLGLQGGSLGHAESMLLVHDRQPEPLEGHAFADHGMGARPPRPGSPRPRACWIARFSAGLSDPDRYALRTPSRVSSGSRPS